MVEKPYDWQGGAELREHSKRKHRVLREYLNKYLKVRCQIPQRDRFRLALVDGFCGSGQYLNGEPGSPFIMLETLGETTQEILVSRAAQGMKPMTVDVLLILNDKDKAAVSSCLENIQPTLGALKEQQTSLSIKVIPYNDRFESIYPSIKSDIDRLGFKSSVLFNLDQCGHSLVDLATITDILRTYPASEVFLTFMVSAFLAFLPQTDQETLKQRLRAWDVDVNTLDDPDNELKAKRAWLGEIEKAVFEKFKGAGAFMTPFSIHNPKGWDYWMLHFANSYRARQVYNDVLHNNHNVQAHYGRSGLKMLSYNPNEDGALYLFDQDGREESIKQLYSDIPKAVANYGDAIQLVDFYSAIYNDTPAHSEDIHKAIIENPDLNVITPNGGERRKANTIHRDDVLKINPQKSFFEILMPDFKEK